MTSHLITQVTLNNAFVLAWVMVYLADSRPIRSKTSDPSTIDVSVFLMYKIKPESIISLYLDYPSINHHSDMVLSAKVIINFPFWSILYLILKDLISKVVNLYTSDNFFKKRDEIEYSMAKKISDVYREKFNCEMMFFQLNEVSLEESFE